MAEWVEGSVSILVTKSCVHSLDGVLRSLQKDCSGFGVTFSDFHQGTSETGQGLASIGL